MAIVAIPVLAAACGIAYWLFTLWCIASFGNESGRRSATQFEPPVSILKPLCGNDPHAYESLRSHCIQNYREFEIIFGVADMDDEIVPVVWQLSREFPRIPISLIHCPQKLGSNLKVSNLIQMMPAARHEYIVINDSDIQVPDNYLQLVVGCLEEPAVGMATCLYRGIAGSSVGSRLESLGISSDFIPGVLCARQLDGGIRFGLGSTLAFSRRSLEKIGGLDPIADFLADDYQIGYRMHQAGLQVEFADCIVDHYLPDYSFGSFLQHQLRWSRAVRTSRPAGYAGLVFTFVIPWSLLALTMMPAVWTWVLFASAVILRYAVWIAVQRGVLRADVTLREAWLLPFRDILAALTWIACYMGHRVVWRGKRFELVHGKLREL